MNFRFARVWPSKKDIHQFAFKLGYLVSATLCLGYLIPLTAEHFGLKPTEYSLGFGGVSFSFPGPKKSRFYHMYVSAAGSVDNPPDRDNDSNPWSPWIDSGIEVTPGECIRIKATGSVHLSLRRIVAEKISPALLLLHESPNYVSPDGTQDADTTPQQKVLKNYSLFNEAPLGKLIGRVRPSQGKANINIPFQVGKGVAYSVPANTVSGKLQFAVNDISFRKQDSEGYWNKDDNSKPKAKSMANAWLGDAPEPKLDDFNRQDAQNYINQNPFPGAEQGEQANTQAAPKKSGNKSIVNLFWFNEARYDFIFREGSDRWPKVTADELLRRAIKLYQERANVKNFVTTKAPDVWYKDNLGGYWVSVEMWPADQACKLP